MIERLFVFFNDTATTEIYTLSLHDALPIYRHLPRVPARRPLPQGAERVGPALERLHGHAAGRDRKSTRLNSSHANISYAVFCLKKKTIYYNPHLSYILTSNYHPYIQHTRQY